MHIAQVKNSSEVASVDMEKNKPGTNYIFKIIKPTHKWPTHMKL